jgi:hypothetical protein
LINQAINSADLTVGTIVKTFNEAAAASTSEDQLMAAYDQGKTSMINALDTIQTNMTRNVGAIANGYDLSPSYTIISTISQAAEVEANLNLEKERAKFDAKFISDNFKEQLSTAESEADVNVVLDGIRTWVDEKMNSLSSVLDTIIFEASQNPALVER